MGLVTYISGDFGSHTFRGVDMEKAIQAFAQVAGGTRVVIASLYSRHSPPLTLIANWMAILRSR
jgi:hypothetical protein